MDILRLLMAGGAALLAFFLYVVISKNIVITALIISSTTFVILLRRLFVSQSQADQRRAYQPPQNLKPIRLNLVIERSNGRVLYAKCDKNFIDVLLSFLVLPLGKVIRLADKKSGIGSIDGLYKSVEGLETWSFWTKACKNMLLEPRSAHGSVFSDLAVKIDQTDYNECYTCSRTPCWSPSLALGFASLVENSICVCRRAMDNKLRLYADRNYDSTGGFITRGERFYVSEDLHVMPAGRDNAQSLFQRRGIKANGQVIVKKVYIGLEEVLQLLHRSVLSKTPLTDVFQPNATTPNINQSRDSPPTHYQYWRGYHPFCWRVINVNLWFSLSAKKVVCVEAQEDFIDFLFSLLTLPLGSIVKLLQGSSSLGSIENLYRGVQVLNERGYVSWQNRQMLCDPKLERMFGCNNQLLNVEEDAMAQWFVNVDHNSLQIVNPKSLGAFPVTRGGGFVRQQGRFLVTDRLLVKPQPVDRDVQRLGMPFSDLRELQIAVGKVEALALLEAALTSETVLSRAFWPKVISGYCLYYGY